MGVLPSWSIAETLLAEFRRIKVAHNDDSNEVTIEHICSGRRPSPSCM